jgi:hypothetical protein
VATGPSAKSIANAVFNFSMIAGGRVSGPIGAVVSLFNDGLSVVQNFISATGYTPIGGEYSDKVQVKVKYDINTKYTYIQDAGGTYILGAVTQRAYIHNVETYMYFVANSSGRESTNIKYVYQTYQTPNDATAAAKAIYWMGDPWSETVSFKVPGSSVVVNF